MDKYYFVKSLGSGASGQVGLYREIETGNEYAIKEVLDKSSNKYIRGEIAALELLREKINVIKIVESFTEANRFYIVLEYCEGGTLKEKLKNMKKIGKKFKISIICELVRAVYYVHSENIIHRDIKLDNILLRNGVLKLTDFGLSVVNSGNAITSCGTPLNMAPEMFSSEKYDKNVDIWSLGCVAYEILKNKHPFQASNLVALNKIQKQSVDVSYLSPEQIEFFDLSFALNPDKRGNIKDLIKSNLVQNYMKRIYEKLDKIFDHYQTIEGKTGKVIRSAISLYYHAEPLYIDCLDKHKRQLKILANYYNVTTFSEKVIKTILKKISEECIKESQLDASYISHLLYLHRRIQNIKNFREYDNLLII